MPRDGVPAAARAGLLIPGWPAAHGVAAAMSTRDGGVSVAPWAALNLGAAVGDDALAVAENRRRFEAALGVPAVYLRQVHGARVVRLTVADLQRNDAIEADAAITTEAGLACTVQVADCLPVLLAAPDGRAVGAAHVGWRGLAAGVLQASVGALCTAAACQPLEVVAWLGPCIGPRPFEVGADVVTALGAGPRFVARPRADGAMRWLADLAGLARERLQAAGLDQISDAAACTVEAPSRFFSFRRDGVTGRMAAAVWRR